jgi:hypothetical protein
MIEQNFPLPAGARAHSAPQPTNIRGCMITLIFHTVGRGPLIKRSALRRELYLKTHNTHNRQTPISPSGFEHAIPSNERPQTYALDRATTGIC